VRFDIQKRLYIIQFFKKNSTTGLEKPMSSCYTLFVDLQNDHHTRVGRRRRAATIGHPGSSQLATTENLHRMHQEEAAREPILLGARNSAMREITTCNDCDLLGQGEGRFGIIHRFDTLNPLPTPPLRVESRSENNYAASTPCSLRSSCFTVMPSPEPQPSPIYRSPSRYHSH